MTQDPSLIVCSDVEGAPVRIGEAVKVVSSSADGTISQRFLGRTGVVVALVYDDPVLQYPADPLIQVQVDGLGEDLFFPEELELAPEWARGRLAQHRQAVREVGKSLSNLPGATCWWTSCTGPWTGWHRPPWSR